MQKTLFSQKLSNLEVWSLSTTYRKLYMGFSKNPSWILMPKCKNIIYSKTKQFKAMVSTDDLYEVVRTWAFQRTHYWTTKIG